MDNFRRSNISLNPINQSHSASPSRVPSVSEIRSRYESAQVDLMVYLKWIIVLIGVVIGILFVKSLVGDSKIEQCAAKTQSFHTRVKDYFRGEEASPRESEVQPGPTPRSAEGFWSYFLPGWAYSELNAIQGKLQTLRPQVQPRLPELPTLESIRTHPGRFNISLADVAQLSAQQLKERFPVEDLVRAVDALTGHGTLGLNPSSAEIEHSRTTAADELMRTEELSRQLQKNTTADLVLKLHQLRSSTEAVAAKRKQINELRISVISAARSLTSCQEREVEQHQVMQDDKLAEAQLQAKIAQLEEKESRISKQIEEKELSLSQNDRQNREVLTALTQRENQLKTKLTRKPTLEQNVTKWRKRLTEVASEIDVLVKKLSEAKEQKAAFEAQHRSSMEQPARLRNDLEVLEVKKKLVEMRLNSLTARKQVKNLLNTLVPDKEKGSSLETIMDKKLTEEKQLLEFVEQYDRDTNPVPDIPVEMKRQIERDESSFQAIIQKYREWQKVVEDYDASDEDIRKLEVQLREVEEQIRLLQKRISEYKGQENLYTERMHVFETGISSAQRTIEKLEAEAKQINGYIVQGQTEVAAWKEDWEKVQEEIRGKESEFRVYRQTIDQNFIELDKERETNRVALEAERGYLKEVRARLHSISESLTVIRTDCTTTKAMYLKVAQLLPQLQHIISHDTQTIAQLKKEIARLVEPFTQLGV